MEEYVASCGQSALVGKDLRDLDLRHADLSDQIMFGTDLTNSNLYGAKISLRCEQFDGCKIDDESICKLLLMISLADINSKAQVGLRDLVRRISGEKHYTLLERWMKLA